MNSAAETLVIINSIVLVAFLIVSIIALFFIIKLVRTLQRLSDKAEAMGEMLGKAAAPVAIGRLFTHVADSVLSRGKKSHKEADDE